MAQTDNGNRDPKMRAQVAKDIRANYLKQVKSVLTPEQYVQFLENQYVNQRPHKQGMKKDYKKREHMQAKARKQGKGTGKCDKPVCNKANADCKKTNIQLNSFSSPSTGDRLTQVSRLLFSIQTPR